jgi:hypothetical protein
MVGSGGDCLICSEEEEHDNREQLLKRLMELDESLKVEVLHDRNG